ncbi:TolC family protein [Erwinia sp. CPCC 100877]|nr:TolC family protein [Erwinia sp. CPCC 100877]
MNKTSYLSKNIIYAIALIFSMMLALIYTGEVESKMLLPQHEQNSGTVSGKSKPSEIYKFPTSDFNSKNLSQGLSVSERGDIDDSSKLVVSNGYGTSSKRVNVNSLFEAELKKSFSELVNSAIKNSPQIKSSMAQIESAKANIDEAKGQRWPQVDVSASSPTKQFGGGVKNKQYDSPEFAVTITTNIYDFGQVNSTIESRQQRLNSAVQEFSVEKENIAWEVVNAAISLYKQQQIIKISKQYVNRMAEITGMLNGIVKMDVGRRSELTQAKGKLIQAQSQLQNAESTARDLSITLKRYIGDKEINLPKIEQWSLGFGSLDEKLQKIEHHPAILKGIADANAALKEAESIKASGRPKLNWTVAKSTAEDDYGRQDAWQTGLTVNWGLFKGGSTKASEYAAILRAQSGKHIVQDNILEYERRVRASDQNAHSMFERANIYKDMIKESEQIRRDFFDQWYHLGRRTLLDVLSAETDYYNQQVSEISNRMDGYSAILKGYSEAGCLVNWLGNDNKGQI